MLRKGVSGNAAARGSTRAAAADRRPIIAAAAGAHAPPAAVLTGASGGIGRVTALLLCSKGWKVFAGVLNEAEAEEMRLLHASIEPLVLDVTDKASVRRAAVAVGEAVGANGLQGLVNNAGIGMGVPVEFFPEDAWELVMAVNTTGALRCVQAFLPLLRAGERRGRVVNMSSLAGSIALPMYSAYAASKRALEALSDSLRFELKPQGIFVSIIKPGPVATEIWKHGKARSEQVDIGEEGRRLYAQAIEEMQHHTDEMESEGIPPEEVAAAVLHALTSPKPRARYICGTKAVVLHVLSRLLPDKWFDPLIAKAIKDAAKKKTSSA